MTDDGVDESGPQDLHERILGAFRWIPFFGLGDVMDASERAVWAVLELVRLALEADEEATAEVLREHEDALDTIYALAKIVRDRRD